MHTNSYCERVTRFTASDYMETAFAWYLTESWSKLTLTQIGDGGPNLNPNSNPNRMSDAIVEWKSDAVEESRSDAVLML